MNKRLLCFSCKKVFKSRKSLFDFIAPDGVFRNLCLGCSRDLLKKEKHFSMKPDTVMTFETIPAVDMRSICAYRNENIMNDIMGNPAKLKELFYSEPYQKLFKDMASKIPADRRDLFWDNLKKRVGE